MLDKIFNNIENYIYMYHTDTFIVIPVYPDSVQDSIGASFSQETPLLRSAPIYAYSNSGPRSVQFTFNLHRDMMLQVNHNTSNAVLGESDDYVDILIKYIQACVLPDYATSQKMVNPPIVAVRLGNDIFCKGVIVGSVGLTYGLPILANGKYATISISFSVNEIEPFDATTVMSAGSFRGMDSKIENKLSLAIDSYGIRT